MRSRNAILAGLVAILMISSAPLFVTSNGPVGNVTAVDGLTLSLPLTLVGDDQVAAHATGSGTTSDPYVIRGLEIDANGGAHGIEISGVTKYTEIWDCVIYNAQYNLGQGINIHDSEKVYLYNVTIYNCQRGIELKNVHNAVVTDSNITNCHYGLVTYNDYDIDIYGNDLSFCGVMYGGSLGSTIQASNVENSTYTDNNLIDNQGYAINGYCINNNTIANNQIVRSGLTALYLYGMSDAVRSYGNTIQSNTFRFGPNAIDLGNYAHANQLLWNWVEGSDYAGLAINPDYARFNTVRGNYFYDNGQHGIFASNSNDNLFVGNYFANNNGATNVYSASHPQAYDDTSDNAWSQGGLGNYWADLQGPDADHNGVVDSPYQLGLTSDLYPRVFSHAIPTGLNATGSNNVINLNWTAPPTPFVLRYEVQRWNAGTGPVTLTTTGTETSISDTVPALDSSTYYSYNVTAVDWFGKSQPTANILVRGPVEAASTVEFVYPYDGAVNSTGSIDFRVVASDQGSGFARQTWVLYYEGSQFDNGYVDDVYLNFTETGLPEGNYTLTDTTNDFAGNIATYSIDFQVDTTLPTVVFTSPANNSYRSSSFTLYWTGSDAVSGIDHYNISNNNGLTWTSVGTSTHIDPPYSQGSHTVLVRAFDKGGNFNTFSFVYTMDMLKPVVTMTTPANNTIFNTTGPYEFAWTADGTGTSIIGYYLSQDGSPFTNLGMIHSFSNTFMPGNHTLVFRAMDQAGNTRDYVLRITIDPSDPVVNILYPGFASGVNASSVTVRWEGHDAITTMEYYWISQNNRDWTNVSGSTEHTLSDLPSGTVNFYVRGFDAAGHNSTASVTFTVDLIAPTVSITSPSEHQNFTSSDLTVELVLEDELSGSGLDTDALHYKLFRTENGEPLSWTTYNYGSYPELWLPMMSDGNFTLIFEASDVAGNSARAWVNFTIDTVAPVISFIFPTEGDATNDTTPMVTWTGHDATSGIHYYQLSVDDGAWQTLNDVPIATIFELGAGHHNVSVRAYDYAGHVSVMIKSNFTIDLTAPELSIQTPGAWSAETPLYASWYAWDNQTGIALREYRVDGGQWTVCANNYTDLTAGEGQHTLEVRITDRAGNTENATVTFIVDTTAPAFEVTIPEEGTIFTSSRVELVWTAATDDGSGLAGYEIRIRNDTFTGPWNDVGLLTSTNFPHIPDGSWTVDIRATDNVGNALVVSRNIHVDALGPWVVFSTPAGGSYVNSTAIEWTAVENGTWPVAFSYSLNGLAGPWTSVGNVSSCSLAGLVQGSNTLTLRGEDAGGHYGYANLTYVYDTVSPSLAIDTPLDGAYVDKTNVPLSWTSADTTSGVDHYEYWLYEGSILHSHAVGTDSSTLATGLADGEWTLVVRAYDRAGNNITATATFTVDTVAPTVSITSPAADAILTGTFTVQWTGSDATSLIERYLYIIDGSEPVDLGNALSYEVTPTHGPHTITIRAVDHAGNSADASLEIYVDNVDPELTITAPQNGTLTSLRTVTVSWTGSGTGSAVARYEIRLDLGPWTDVGLSVGRTFNSLADGQHVIEVRAYDQAGHFGERSVTITVDATAPTVVSHGPTGDNVSLAAPIAVAFSESMDAANTTISVQGLTGAMSWSGNVLTLDPSANLTMGEAYTVVVNGKDLAGNTIHYEWSFTATENGVLGGRVVDENGDPVVGATVSLDNGTMVTTTDAEGYFYFNVPPGSYTLTIVMAGYDTIVREVEVTDEDNGDNFEVPSVTLAKAKAPDMSMVVALVATAALAAILIMYVLVRKRAPKQP